MISQSNSSEGVSPRRYIDPDTLFTIDVPNGWLVDSSGQMGSSVILFHPQVEHNFRTTINVVVHQLGALTPEEFLTLTRLQLKQLPEFTLQVDDSISQPPGARLLEWAAEPGPMPLKVRQLLVYQRDNVYVVTATALLALFEFQRNTIETTVSSFRTLAADPQS